MKSSNSNLPLPGEQPAVTPAAPPGGGSAPGSPRRAAALRIASLALVVLIMAGIYFYRDHIQDLYHYGYAGIFFVTLIANATVFLPVPGVAFVFAMGSVLHPGLIAVFAGAGAAVGEVSGYLLGYSGQGLAEQSDFYARVYTTLERRRNLTDLAILIMAAIPNPFFDAAGIAAGALKVPLWRFLLFAALGSMIKMLLFAYAGELGVGWITDWYARGR